MASIVKDDKTIEPREPEDREEERDRSDETEARQDKNKHAPPPATATHDAGPGFFHIYKSGQGYWTRMGTVLGAVLIGGLTAYFLYQHMHVWITPLFMPKGVAPASTAQAQAAAASARNATIFIIGGLLAVYGLIVFWLMNKPTNADFLIATDSEMKKVNWTSRKELIGSTKVVIFFMFLIAVMLFSFDIIFGYLFYAIHVLKSKPF